MEFLLLDIADLFFQSSYRVLCLKVKNHVVEKMGLRMEMPTYWRFIFYVCMGLINLTTHTFPLFFLGSDLLDLCLISFFLPPRYVI
jgi:hypothetical protein